MFHWPKTADWDFVQRCLQQVNLADLAHRQISELVRKVGIEWANNVLRHSFISYRIATVKSAEQVALEAGNSPAIIFKHYRELATEAQADEWFGILPKEDQFAELGVWKHRKRRKPGKK